MSEFKQGVLYGMALATFCILAQAAASYWGLNHFGVTLPMLGIRVCQ